jgi:hypothetical protein
MCFPVIFVLYCLSLMLCAIPRYECLGFNLMSAEHRNLSRMKF